MNNIEKIIVILLLFSSVLTINYFIKRKRATVEKARQIELTKYIQQYFVTICYKTLTPFGDESDSRGYITFEIVDRYLYVFKISHSYGTKSQKTGLMKIKLEDSVLIDQKTKRVFSFGEFERYLSRFLKNSLVYDSTVREQWGMLKKQSKVQ